MLKPEQMHRIKDGGNDWDGIPDDDLSYPQRIAKKTRGILTAANVTTGLGVYLVINGLIEFAQGNRGVGFAEIAAGRICDVADGAIAHATKTKGKFGRDLDPTADVIELGVALPVLESTGTIPLIPTLIVAVPKIVEVGASIAARARGVELNASATGKERTAGIWAGIGMFALHATVGRHIPQLLDTTVAATGWVGTVGGTIYGLPATREYIQAGFGAQAVPPNSALKE